MCKEVSLWLFAVYRKSKGGCEVGPTSAQYASAAAHLFGWRTYHPSWHWCCLHIVAAVPVCSRHKLQVSSLLLIEVCHCKFYITHFLCYRSTFTEDQNLLVVQYLFVFVVRPLKPFGGLTVNEHKYSDTSANEWPWFWLTKIFFAVFWTRLTNVLVDACANIKQQTWTVRPFQERSSINFEQILDFCFSKETEASYWRRGDLPWINFENFEEE